MKTIEISDVVYAQLVEEFKVKGSPGDFNNWVSHVISAGGMLLNADWSNPTHIELMRLLAQTFLLENKLSALQNKSMPLTGFPGISGNNANN